MKRNFIRAIIMLSILLAILFSIGLMLGTITIRINDIFLFFTSTQNPINFVIALRLNRELVAFICGAMLATGSALLQGLTRNPMVAPDLMGTTSMLKVE